MSYRTPDVVQSEFTPKDLFNAVYSEKVVNDFKNGKLTETGEPLEPSQEEQLTLKKLMFKLGKLEQISSRWYCVCSACMAAAEKTMLQ